MDEKKFPVRVELNMNLTQQDIDDIMCAALEGGICYWCRRAEVVEEKRCSEWGHEQIARGGALILHDAESSDKWELNLEKFLTGFKLWVEKGYDRYGAVKHDHIDAYQIDGEAADLIVQLALFGDVVFG